MLERIRLRQTVVFAVLVAFTTATVSCSSYRVVKPESSAMRANLNVGDWVKLTTKDGQQWQFIVVEIRPDSLFSSHRGIAFVDVTKIEKKSRNETGRHIAGAIGVGLGVLAVAFLVGMVSLAIALDDLGD
jgi:hypothetical protein